jgi:hypothetical protein
MSLLLASPRTPAAPVGPAAARVRLPLSAVRWSVDANVTAEPVPAFSTAAGPSPEPPPPMFEV